MKIKINIIVTVCALMCGYVLAETAPITQPAGEAIVIELPDGAAKPWNDTIANWPPLSDSSIIVGQAVYDAPPPDSVINNWKPDSTIENWPPLQDSSIIVSETADTAVQTNTADDDDTATAAVRPQLIDRPDIVPPPSGQTVYISGIEIYGNADRNKKDKQADCIEVMEGIKICGGITTKPKYFVPFLSFKIGDTLDLDALKKTRDDLMRTQLYSTVDIFPHMREDGAHIFIVLKESVRLQLGYGATYYTRKHGRDDFWYYFSGDATLYNFRGRMEEITVGGSLWESTTFNIAWTKPFLGTPYYITTGTGIDMYPDKGLPLDYTDLFASMTIGIMLTDNTSLSMTGIPMYRYRKTIKDHDQIAFPERSDFYEAFAAINMINDFRPTWFDPKEGWYMNTELRTNMPYPGINKQFIQFRNEFRLYLPLLFDDIAAMRFVLTLRDNFAGDYRRLTYGSTGTLRGYYEEALGWHFEANSSVLMSFKYHKPIWESPPLPLPIFGTIYNMDKSVYRIDATLIADYARLYNKPMGALTFEGEYESGIGLGFGTRIMVPEIRQSGCIDLVFGLREKEGGGQEWKHMIHVYLDLFY